MAPPFDVISIDCYGTLIDWETGISTAFLQTAASEGVKLDATAVLSAYAAIEPQVEAETFRSYREVLTETARRVAAQFGWTLDERQAGFLADGLPTWQPFADTNPGLKRLERADTIRRDATDLGHHRLPWRDGTKK